MKKRIILGILIVGLVAISIGVAAAQYGQDKNCASTYVDADGDGVCDNYNDRINFVDTDGDGICDNIGQNGRGNCGSCLNFVDDDGDGICDNIGENGRDDDGDGIPNGQDDDYVKLQDGSGNGGQQRGRNR